MMKTSSAQILVEGKFDSLLMRRVRQQDRKRTNGCILHKVADAVQHDWGKQAA